MYLTAIKEIDFRKTAEREFRSVDPVTSISFKYYRRFDRTWSWAHVADVASYTVEVDKRPNLCVANVKKGVSRRRDGQPNWRLALLAKEHYGDAISFQQVLR